MGYLDSAGLARLWEKIKAAALPPGCIVIWSGWNDQVPEGWALCDGENGTPDLRGRFVLGATPDWGADWGVGIAGGEETHTLTGAEMPLHSHLVRGYAISGAATGAQSVISAYEDLGAENLNSTTETGGGQPHNNMPPYYVLCYIMKL